MSGDVLTDCRQAVATASDKDHLRTILLAQAAVLNEALGADRPGHSGWSRLRIYIRPKRMLSAGACVDLGTHRVIFVRDSDHLVRQRFTVAHEAAHLLLSDVHQVGSVTLPRPVEEKLCDEFAAALLIPSAELARSLRDANWSDPDLVIRLCHDFRVGLQPIVIALAKAWPDPDRMLLVGQKAGHPQRPTEIATRVLAHAGHGPIFVPRHQRLSSLGLTRLARWADDDQSERRRNGGDSARFKTWSRLGHRSRTGVCVADAEWDAHKLSNGLMVSMIRLKEVVLSWADPRVASGEASRLAAPVPDRGP